MPLSATFGRNRRGEGFLNRYGAQPLRPLKAVAKCQHGSLGPATAQGLADDSCGAGTAVARHSLSQQGHSGHARCLGSGEYIQATKGPHCLRPPPSWVCWSLSSPPPFHHLGVAHLWVHQASSDPGSPSGSSAEGCRSLLVGSLAAIARNPQARRSRLLDGLGVDLRTTVVHRLAKKTWPGG